GDRVLVVGVDEGAVDVEDGGGLGQCDRFPSRRRETAMPNHSQAKTAVRAAVTISGVGGRNRKSVTSSTAPVIASASATRPAIARREAVRIRFGLSRCSNMIRW